MTIFLSVSVDMLQQLQFLYDGFLVQVRDELYEELSVANWGKKFIFVFLLELLFSFVGIMQLTINFF
jgi:hypothetical protein